MENETIENKSRAVIFNPKTEKIAIILFKSSQTYMLPGGRRKNGESSIQTLIREVCQETGIELEGESIAELCEQRSEKKYILEKTKKDIITKFYLIKTYKNFDISKMKLTKRERDGGLKPYWIRPSILIGGLRELIEERTEDERFVRNANETIYAVELFQKRIQKEKQMEIQGRIDTR